MSKPVYVCTELAPKQSGYVSCKTWQELDNQPILPKMTKQQADDMTIAILSVIFLAFGWFVLIRLIRSYR